MVKSCCAYNCTERAVKGVVSFHSFPKNTELRKKWIIAIKRQDFEPNESSRICGKHFIESDYVTHFGQRRLKPDALPSIFDFPKHLQKQVKLRKSRKRSRSVSLSEESDVFKILKTDNPVPSTTESDPLEAEPLSSTSLCEIAPSLPLKTITVKECNKRSTYFGDIKSKNLKSNEAKEIWHTANRQINKYRRTIKALNMNQYRLKRKVKSLQDLVIHLKNSKKGTEECADILQTLEPEFPVHIFSSCHTKLHSFCTFKKQCLENNCRFTETSQESDNAKDQSFSAFQIEIKNIKEENQVDVDLTNEVSEELNSQINFITKEDAIEAVQDETISPGLNRNINEDSGMTDDIKSYKCEEQHDQTNNFIEDIIKLENSEEPNLYQELLLDIKKEIDSVQDTNEIENADLNFNRNIQLVT